MNSIIDDIKQRCSDLFPDKLIFSPLNESLNRSFIISGTDLSPAWNIHNGERFEVNARRWFDNFWIYLQINFIQQPIESKLPRGYTQKQYFELLDKKFLIINKQHFNVIISISLFQGGYLKEEKTQLFRAEWDNYKENIDHPQPHWHFYPKGRMTLDFDPNPTIDFLEETPMEEIDLKRMHFAMNGQWAQNGNHIHSINDKKDIVNWLVGILRHIKKQLEVTKALKRYY